MDHYYNFDFDSLEADAGRFIASMALEALSSDGGTIKQVFDVLCEDLVVDNYLVEHIAKYKRGFINKNEDHIAFFGGNLLGVEIVRHTSTDRSIFFEDVIGIDENEARAEIVKTPLIESDFARLSDPYNTAALYLIYRLHNSPKLSQAKKIQAKIDVFYMLQVKLFTSLLSHWYDKPASVEEAKATYASLSLKFDIKQAGSWDVWFTQRAERFFLPNAIHHACVEHYSPDVSVTYAVTEPQDRLREVMKKIFQVHLDVRRNGGRIRTTTSTLTIDGELMVKSHMNANKRYVPYILGVMQDPNTFIRDECVTIVTEMVGSVSPNLFLELLKWTSEAHRGRMKVPTGELAEELVLHAVDYIQVNRVALKRVDDLAVLISRLKDLYMASRMRDTGLIKARDMALQIVTKSRLSKSDTQISSLRTALELYIVVRALTMNYYK
jgi:hypothetical protein